jgi:CheY-like chemotaxis protein
VRIFAFMANEESPILIAEDDENDAILLRRAIQKTNVKNPIKIVGDGELAIEYLSNAEKRIVPVPAFLITDLKMPRKNGFEILEWRRNNPKSILVPIVVWSSSKNLEDVERAYRLGANTYFAKPPTLPGLEQLIARIFAYWIDSEKAHLETAFLFRS